jgi:cytidine deaminase
MTQEDVKPLIYEYINKISIPFNDSDHLLMGIAENGAGVHFEQGYTQIVAVGVDDTGNIHTEIQLDCPRGQDSVCAELFLVSKIRKRHRKLVKAVAWRHGIGVANPCEGCAAAYLHFFPDMEVISWAAGERRKLPIRGLIPVPFKKRQPSAKINGNDEADEITVSA